MRAAAMAVLLALPAAQAWAARTCSTDLGQGWPPAVGNYGEAVERLFDGARTPMLSLVVLPPRGVESGVSLTPAGDGQDWILRSSVADKRVYNWNSNSRGGGLELRVDQSPKQDEVPMPAALAQRLVRTWQAALEGEVPADVRAPVLEGEVLSFQVDGARYSGSRPGCGAGKLMLEQVSLLVTASDTKEKKRDRRWSDLEASLDELQQLLTGAAG
ncbi:hypothetical protein OK345_04200 [Xanthomonas sp. H13-6]|uniref:Uncharacterized protein n=1 Tax=Xanthomonas chitinilytica TaxID=2989819 RepID=A0ABT3JT97_9XANT|nr:hypothetical protein [Xanthomonas sp. H13-6]MCW4471708.1 hypothetical protein [Xanthomonas sp. H13-6]